MTILNVATPGPWRAKSERIIVAQVSYVDDRGRERFYDKEIAWMQPIGSTVMGSREANARIVAAAPDMLKALVDLEAYLRDTPHHNAPEAAAARAILRIVRGESL